MLPTPSRISELIALVQQRKSPFELVYQSHSKWPLPTAFSESDLSRSGDSNALRRSAYKSPRPLRISILDSSFNPPTRAHLALARSKRPSRSTTSTTSADDIQLPTVQPRLTVELEASNDQHHDGQNDDVDECDYDARLLLLSVRNVDKTLKPGDANYVQRIEMMHLLSRELERKDGPTISINPEDVIPESNQRSSTAKSDDVDVAIGIIDEPTFVRKAEVLHKFLDSRISALLSDDRSTQPPGNTQADENQLHVQLSFLMGYDTLERLFAPRYYAPTFMSPLSAQDAGVDADVGKMHAALRAFFFEASADSSAPRCAVVCARRDPNSWSKASSLENTNASAESDSRAPELVHARPYIDAGCVSFIELSADEASMSSSKVRRRVREEADLLKSNQGSSRGEERGKRGWRRMVCDEIVKYIAETGLYLENWSSYQQ